jgi:hypothetical protein
MKFKPRAGKGARATVLTKMIYPRRQVEDPKEKSTVTLLEEKEILINRKEQFCYTFHVDGNSEVCHAIKRYVHVLEEGEASELFDPSLPGPEQFEKEQAAKAKTKKKLKWRKSKAQQILYGMLVDGTVPMEDDPNMPLEDIYLLDEEFSKFEYEQFKGRLNRLRAKIVEMDNRANADLEAFRVYKQNHKPSLFSHKGYIQWQGSTAQELLWDDLDDYLKDPDMKPKDLWLKRKEYSDEFPLDAFRDKIKQEIRTAKYIRTRQARARGEKI